MELNNSATPGSHRPDPSICRPGSEGGPSWDAPASRRRRRDPFIYRPGPERDPDNPDRPFLGSFISIPRQEPGNNSGMAASPAPDTSTDVPESERGSSSDIPAGLRSGPSASSPGPEQGNGIDTPAKTRVNTFLSLPWLEVDSSSERPAKHWLGPFVQHPRSEQDNNPYNPPRNQIELLQYPTELEHGNSSHFSAGCQSDPFISTPESELGNGSEKGNGLDIPAIPQLNSVISFPELDGGSSSETLTKRRRDPFIYRPGSERTRSLSRPSKHQLDPPTRSERSKSVDITPKSWLDFLTPASGPEECNSSNTPARRRLDPFIYRPGPGREKSPDISVRPHRDPIMSVPGPRGSNSSTTPAKHQLASLMHRPESERNPQPAEPAGGRASAGTLPGGDQGEDVLERCFSLWPPPVPEPTVRLADTSTQQPEDRSGLSPAMPTEEQVWPHRALFFSPPSPLSDPPPPDAVVSSPEPGPSQNATDDVASDKKSSHQHRTPFFRHRGASKTNMTYGTSGEADSVNSGNEGPSCWSNFSLAMLTGDQEETSAEQVGEDCEDDDTANRRQELLEEPNPVVKLERYAYSDIVFNRQLVTRNIVETLRAVLESQEAVDAVLTALSSLSLDCEPSVRTELVEQLPNIASFCASEGGLLENVVREHVVPILVQYLTDVANQVRKRTQVSLLFILERALIDRKQLEEQICSLVVHLTGGENVEDYRMEAVTLMTKMAPYVGKETTAGLFLPRFVSLCQDASFHLRKVCATNFGDFCSIVGQECTEENLNVFQMLCEDCVWGVRKACAEVFMPVSCVCSLPTRRNTLAPLFLSLLDDQSRWVRIAAFQALGPFISTFADPLRTGLYCSDDGVVSMRAPDGSSDACSDEEVESSPGGPPIPLRGTNTEEGTVATDFFPTLSIVPTAADPVNCGEDDKTEDTTSSALLEKGRKLKAFDDDEGEPCRASSCTAAGKDTCVHKSCAATVSMPEKLQDATTGRNVQTDAPEEEQEGCTEISELKEVLSVGGDRERLVLHVDSGVDSDFNTFQFWRVPIPELEVDIEFLGNRATAVHVRAKSQSQGNRCFSSDLSIEVLGASGKQTTARTVTSLSQDSGISSQRLSGDSSTLKIRTASLSSLTSADQECNVLLSSSVTEASVAFNEAGEVAGVHKVRMSNSKEVAGTENTLLAKSLNSSSDSWSAHDQDVVPVLLLERYQTMTDPLLAQNLDSEIGRHCAHSLPAVALTLGPRFWPCLRTTYRCLVSDVQWKVRHIVASCLHELATILGPQIASRDLVPSFEGFVRDVDEVRVGLLERLAPFLRGLSRGDQRRSLPLLADFLCMDNHRNWRFRFTLARQLKEIAVLYSPRDVHQYLVPIVSELLVDKVAEVRHISIEAAVVVLKRLRPHYLMCKEFLQQLCDNVQDRKWCHRQLFCELAEQMITGECFNEEEFIGTVLPKLLYLRHDSVPNVRMALARCLVKGVWPKAFFWDSGNLYRDELKGALASLQEDPDRDVRFCAQLYPKDSVD